MEKTGPSAGHGSSLCQSCGRGSLQAGIHFRALSCCQGKQPACRQVARAEMLCLALEAAGRSPPRSTMMMSCFPKSWDRRALFSHSLPLSKHSGTARQPDRPSSGPALPVSPSLSPSPRGTAPSPHPPALCNRSSVRAGCCRCFISPSPWQLASSSTRRDPRLLSAINQPPAFIPARPRGHGSPWVPLGLRLLLATSSPLKQRNIHPKRQHPNAGGLEPPLIAARSWSSAALGQSAGTSPKQHRAEDKGTVSLSPLPCPSMSMGKPSKSALRAQKPPKMLCCPWCPSSRDILAQQSSKQVTSICWSPQEQTFPTRTEFPHTLLPHGKGLKDMLLSPSQTHSRTCSCC